MTRQGTRGNWVGLSSAGLSTGEVEPMPSDNRVLAFLRLAIEPELEEPLDEQEVQCEPEIVTLAFAEPPALTTIPPSVATG